MFDAPIVGPLATAMGGIRVDRGTGSDEPLKRAAAALEAGELVALDAAGDDPARRGVLQPGAEGSLRRGAPRGDDGGTDHPHRHVGHGEGLAAQRARARVWNILRPPTVRVRVGEPVLLSGQPDDVEADTKAIMDALVALLPEEARTYRAPTDEEIKLAKPPK